MVKDLREIYYSARTSTYDWKERPRRSPHDLKTFRNECMFIEDQNSELLNRRIMMCRKYNQAQNMLTKSMANGKLTAAKIKFHTSTNRSNPTTSHHSDSSLQDLNHVITDTMHRLTALQEGSHISLNHTQNKLSIVPWDRILQAFKSHDVFVWDVTLKDNLRLLVLTTTHTKPKNDNFLQITNINYYSDISTLPMVAKLLRNEYQTEKSKYLGKVYSDYQLLTLLHHSRIKL